MTPLELFGFTQFKTVMNVSDIDEPTYALILKGIFAYLMMVHEIDVDNLTEITDDFIYAIYRHATYMHYIQATNAMNTQTASDASGNRVVFDVKPPKDIISVYKMYSPVPPALL